MAPLTRYRRRRYRRRMRRNAYRYRVPRTLNSTSSSVVYVNIPWQFTASVVLASGAGHSDLVKAKLLVNSGQRGTILKEPSFRQFANIYEFFRIVKASGTLICGNIVGNSGIQMVELVSGWQRSCWYNGPELYTDLLGLMQSGSSRRKISTGQNQIRQRRAIRASGLMEKGGWISTLVRKVGNDYDLDDYASGNVHDKLSPALLFGVGVIPPNAPTAQVTVQVSLYGNVKVAFKGPRYGATALSGAKGVSFLPDPDDEDDDDDDEMDESSSLAPSSSSAEPKNVETSEPTALTRQQTLPQIPQLTSDFTGIGSD